MLSKIYTMLTKLEPQEENGARFFTVEVELNIFQHFVLYGAIPDPNGDVWVIMIDGQRNRIEHRLEENAEDAPFIEALYQHLLKAVPVEREVSVP